MYILGAMYILSVNMYILGVHIYISGANKYILGVKIDNLCANIYIRCYVHFGC